MSLVRSYIRSILKEQSEVEEIPGLIPKGVWTFLDAGDPRREVVKQQLYSMVCDTYSKIGGHVRICEPNSLDRYQYWVVQDIDDDPEIDVGFFGKPEFGAKSGGAANDGSDAAKTAYKEKGAELRRGGSVGGIGNWWSEISGTPAYAMLKRGAIAVEDPAKVAQLLAGDVYTWHGSHPDPDAPALFKSVNGWYTKDFGKGGKHTKIILGNPTI